MKLDIFHVNAFSDKIFGGNPAAVIPLKSWLDDKVMQNIATENNLPATAFIVEQNGAFFIQWFTPTVEVELCGHATLAAAHVIYNHFAYVQSTCTFQTQKRGLLLVEKTEGGLTMDFPKDNLKEITQAEKYEIREALHITPIDYVKGSDDYLAILENADLVQNFKPDLQAIKKLDARGIIISSRAKSPVDFISRCFYPNCGIDEDPVTGSAHTLLAPYWAAELGLSNLTAIQASKRVGKITCECLGERVLLRGASKTFMIGQIQIPSGLSS